MSTLVYRAPSRTLPAPPVAPPAEAPPMGATARLARPFVSLSRRVRRTFDFSFDLDACTLCDEASVHADLA
jgi:hypothetical protein